MAAADIGAEWMEALGGALQRGPEQVPEGWHTVREIAAMTGYSEVWTYKKLLRLVEQGKAEIKRFRITTGLRTMRVTHYQISGGI
jgi:hypothetical protein